MQMQHRHFYGIVTLVLLTTAFLWNCGDQATEKSKPLIVSKKITAHENAKLDEVGDETQKKDEIAKDTVSTTADEQEIGAKKRIYDPTKRLNPFTPLFKPDEEKAAVDQMGKSKRKKRTAQTPLERISLEQLQLRAVIRAPSGNRALVEDNSGKGYIIKIGTYIGLNSGIVTQINADSVVIEEEIENLMGELVLQNTEIKLQKPTGE
jgi:type IV pilus assembly protein PilP